MKNLTPKEIENLAVHLEQETSILELEDFHEATEELTKYLASLDIQHEVHKYYSDYYIFGDTYILVELPAANILFDSIEIYYLSKRDTRRFIREKQLIKLN